MGLLGVAVREQKSSSSSSSDPKNEGSTSGQQSLWKAAASAIISHNAVAKEYRGLCRLGGASALRRGARGISYVRFLKGMHRTTGGRYADVFFRTVVVARPTGQLSGPFGNPSKALEHYAHIDLEQMLSFFRCIDPTDDGLISQEAFVEAVAGAPASRSAQASSASPGPQTN